MFDQIYGHLWLCQTDTEVITVINLMVQLTPFFLKGLSSSQAKVAIHVHLKFYLTDIVLQGTKVDDLGSVCIAPSGSPTRAIILSI